MEDNGFVLLDTKAFDDAISRKDDLIASYNQLNEKYDKIVSDLLANWQGMGADAFEKDARTVKTNIVGVYDILKTMCDTLTDCKAIFVECDQALGDFNRNPDAGEQ